MPATSQYHAAGLRSKLDGGIQDALRHLVILITLTALVSSSGQSAELKYEVLVQGGCAGELIVSERRENNVIVTERRFESRGAETERRVPVLPYRSISRETLEGLPLRFEVYETSAGEVAHSVSFRTRYESLSTPSRRSVRNKDKSFLLFYGQRLLRQRLYSGASTIANLRTYDWRKEKAVSASYTYEAREGDLVRLSYSESTSQGALVLYVRSDGVIQRLVAPELHMELCLASGPLTAQLVFHSRTGIPVSHSTNFPHDVLPNERAYRIIAKKKLATPEDGHQKRIRAADGTTWIVASDAHTAWPVHEEVERFLAHTPLVPLDKFAHLERAASTGAREGISPLVLCELVRARMGSPSSNERVLDAHAAWEARSGDCTEYAVLLTALARKYRFPARLAVGLVYENTRASWHMCVEIAEGGYWQLYDATLPCGQPGKDFIRLFSIRPEHEGSIFDESRSAMLSIERLECHP